MHFSLATIIAIVPLLATASPLAEQPHTKIPLSKRSNILQRDGSVNLDRLKEHRASSNAKIMNGFDNYEKNTGQRHPMQPEAVSKRALGSVPLTDDDVDVNEGLWYGPISVGTPAKRFTVQYDTGSADLFLPDSSCGSTCAEHTLYDPSASTTSTPLNKDFTFFRGLSSIAGKQYNDTVEIAGLTAASQTLASATRYSSIFQRDEFPADGVMGMGFKSISNNEASPLFQTLVETGQTTSGVFAFKLAPSSGELTLGGLDSNLYSGTPTYTPVLRKAFWQINVPAIKIGGTTVAKSARAIVVSSNALIVGPEDQVNALYSKIPGSKYIGDGLYTFPCFGEIPPISFTIGKKELPMSSSTLIVGPVEPGSSICVGSITIDVDFDRSSWIIGEAFMRNYYTIFDYDKGQVGFADLK